MYQAFLLAQYQKNKYARHMTPDRRLDQLEPLMAENSAQLDLHTAQLRRIAQGIQLITESISQQSDSITFLLQEVAGVKQDQIQMKTDIQQIRQEQGRQTETLTAILNILQGRSNN